MERSAYLISLLHDSLLSHPKWERRANHPFHSTTPKGGGEVEPMCVKGRMERSAYLISLLHDPFLSHPKWERRANHPFHSTTPKGGEGKSKGGGVLYTREWKIHESGGWKGGDSHIKLWKFIRGHPSPFLSHVSCRGDRSPYQHIISFSHIGHDLCTNLILLLTKFITTTTLQLFTLLH